MGTCHQSLPGRVGQRPEIRAPVFPKHKLGSAPPPPTVKDTQALCGAGIAGLRTSTTPLTSQGSSLCAARAWLSALEPLLGRPLYNLPAKVAAGREGRSVR